MAKATGKPSKAQQQPKPARAKPKAKPKEVWLLTVGSHSDWRVLAVFDAAHKKQGEELAKLVGGELEAVAPLNTFEHEQPPAGEYHRVCMYRDGTFATPSPSPLPPLDESGKVRPQRYYVQKDARRSGVWRLWVEGYFTDHDQALAAVAALHAAILAGDLPEEGTL